MTKTTVNFVYLAHGDDRFLRQALYSILTLMEYKDKFDFPARYIVYTDSPGFFADYPDLITEVADANRLRQWCGKLAFVHRAKIKVMQHVMEKYKGHALFFDSDNCVFSDPSPVIRQLDSGDSIMDKLEYTLDEPADLIGKKYRRWFRKNRALHLTHRTVHVPEDHPVWNSGVIGVAEQHKRLMDEALPICDYIYERFPKHLAEQLAVGIVLGQDTEVHAFRPYSFHWFGHGQAINEIIEELFEGFEGLSLTGKIAAVAASKDRVRNAPLNPDKQPKWYKRLFG